MGYMNRVSTLISGGHRVVKAAILYHGEAEWAGRAMLSQKVARILSEAQVEFDTIPCDVFAEPERYKTVLGSTLKVNTQEYSVLIVPQAQFVTAAFAKAAARLRENGMMVYFLNSLPEGIMDGDNGLLAGIAACPVLSPEQLRDAVKSEAKFVPASSYLRAMHYQGKSEFYFFVNEARETYHGSVTLPSLGSCYWYDAWSNRIYPASPKYNSLDITLEPLHSAILVLDEGDPALLSEPVCCAGEEIPLAPWLRSTCDGIDYPAFGAPKAVTLPDCLAKEQPAFSGFVRYESSFTAEKGQKISLELTEAYEGVELFLNGRSAGIQIAPPYRYDLTDLVQTGENSLVIEVATTLERQCYEALKDDVRSKMRGLKEPTGGSGITGTITVRAGK